MDIFESLTGFSVLWPRLLWLLALLPVPAVLYFRLGARRGGALAQLPGLGHPVTPQTKGDRLRRTLPPVLLLLGLLLLLGAVARPQAILTLPSAHRDVILALDVSGSMRATDVQPDRLAAAKKAARTFIERLPPRTRAGIITVAGNATIIQSPTDNREDLLEALDRVQLERGSAIGSGIYISLATLLPDAGINIDQLVHGRPDFRTLWPPAPDGANKEQKPVAPGSNRSAAIVLLSDGENNFGPDPLKAATLAAEHGVRVYTVGIGSSEGIALTVGGSSMRVSLDEETLRKIAETTLGEYYAAGSAQDLRRIYDQLGARMAISGARTVEVTAFFAIFGALLLAISALCSMLWFNRVA
ncbi:MAG: VWA domain-containing protein [Burkholderiales bacterium]|nr:VWA domain-containing protein [Burkholderiales bacterium]